MQISIKELLKNSFYFSNESCANQEIENIIAKQEDLKEALMVYSSKVVCKSKLFKNALSKKEGNKIYIDFKNNTYMSSFPGYYLVREIYKKLDEYNIAHKGVFPDTPVSDFKLDVETHYNNLLGVLKCDLYSLELNKPLYILISNIDLPYDNDFSMTFYRHFVFDKRTLPENLHVFLLTSNNTQKEENSEYLESVEIVANDNPKPIFKELMEKGERSVNDEALLTANPLLRLRDYIYIAGYILNYCGKNEESKALNNLLSKNNTDEVLLYIFDEFYGRLSKLGRVIFSEALLDLYMFNLGLTEYNIVNSGRFLMGRESHYLANYNEVSEEEKDLILSFLEFFTTREDDRLIITDRVIREFIGSNAMILTNTLTATYKERLYLAVDHAYGDNESIEVYDYRGNYHMIKYIYERQFDQDERFSKKNIVRYAVFDPLIKRIKEVIDEYAKELEDNSDLDRRIISDKDAFMLAFIERSSIIYQSSGLFTPFNDLLDNQFLMYQLMSKSRRLVRRLVNRCIDTGFDYQARISNGQTDGSGIYVPIAGMFSYLFFGKNNKKYDQFKEELTVLVADVFRENDILIGGDFKDFIQNYHVTPITDFVLCNGSSDLIKDHNYLEEALKDNIDPNFDNLISDLCDFSKKYQETENVFHKIIYAYFAFRIYIFLGENKKVTRDISSRLEPIMEDILIYTEYCYYPEVYGAIYMYFGRIYPLDYLKRMEIGINLMRSQGYKKEIRLFVTAYKYFSSVKKEGR